MLIHIAVTCCLTAASFAAPQGYGGYGGATRNSVVQGSALPMRFSVSKGSQGKGYLPPSAYATARPQYQNGGNGYQSSGGSQYQGSGYQGGSSSQYQGSSASQYSGSAGGQYGGGNNQYGRGGEQYTTEDPYAEPANYDFSYEVNAPEYAVMFGHQESRRDMFARGSYKVLLPDGRTQVVEYEADQEGYRPTVTYQEATGGAGGNGGYSQGGNGGYSQGGNGGYSQGGNGGYSQGGYQARSNQAGYQGGRGGNGGYSQNGGGGYSQNGNGYPKGTNAGKASYGQKSYSGNNGGSRGYQGAGKGQGYKY